MPAGQDGSEVASFDARSLVADAIDAAMHPTE